VFEDDGVYCERMMGEENDSEDIFIFSPRKWARSGFFHK
jgi:hypothetical protein